MMVQRIDNGLSDNRRFLADLIEHSAAVIFVKDLEGRYELVNRRYEEVTGMPREAVIGHVDAELFPGDAAESFRQSDLRVIESGQVVEVGDFVDRSDGQIYLMTIKFPLRGEDGKVIGVCGMSTDISERKQAEDALKKANQQMEVQLKEIRQLHAALRDQANRDSLTQLYNRRFLADAIEREFHLVQRRSQPLSIILLDIDHFKSVNDSFGHSVGDECLVALARFMQQHFRKSDIICRYGGDEFLIVLPDSSTDLSTQRVEELRRLVADRTIQSGTRSIRFTVSSGIATYPAHGEKSTDIIRKADQALYVSKQAGRNQVTVWSDAINIHYP